MNRRNFISKVLGLIPLATIYPTIIRHHNYVPPLRTPGEFILSKRFDYSKLYISPEALEDIRNWSTGGDNAELKDIL